VRLPWPVAILLLSIILWCLIVGAVRLGASYLSSSPRTACAVSAHAKCT
jgi:hypothetical protein